MSEGEQYRFISFDESLSDICIPTNIRKVMFAEYFNDDISMLPNHITNIILGDFYGATITKLPTNLISLDMSGVYKPIITNLPPLLRYLILTPKYSKKLPDFPPDLIELRFGTKYYSNIYEPNKQYKYVLNTYYLLKFHIFLKYDMYDDAKLRCKINRHNLVTKQTAFYDVLL